MAKKIETVAIIGGGPAGATLGTLLAKNGYKVGIFHTDKRPPLIVGESLLPAVVPIMRTLGIEEEVKAFSIYKPGATVCLNVDEVISSFFRMADGTLPDYSYNTPRDLFDRAVLGAAERAGVTIFRLTAKLERGEEPDSVRLTDETREATGDFFAGGPDLIVDASGRVRAIPRVLDIPFTRGGREDVALFAHLDKSFMTDPGNIHVDYLTKGWAWRIPLPGRISIGVVINPMHLKQYGETIEAQFDGFLKDEPSLKFYTKDAMRMTPVVRYTNYQIISDRMYGRNWVAIGDSAGFIDPVFSTGLYLGMKGAFEVFKAIEGGQPNAMRKYESGRHWELRMWQGVIDSWYNGKLFNFYRVGQRYKNGVIGARLTKRIQKRLGRIFTGQAVDNVFNMKIFDYLISFGTVMRNPQDLVVV